MRPIVAAVAIVERQTATKISETVEAVAAYGFSAAEIADIERGNALRLFSRLAG